mgnify:CR=1 FL=1
MTYDDIQELGDLMRGCRVAANRSPDTLTALENLDSKITEIANRMCRERAEAQTALRAMQASLDTLAGTTFGRKQG